MKPRNDYEKFILDEAECIKKREEFIAQKVKEIKEKSLTKTDRFLRWWNDKFIPAVLIIVLFIYIFYEH